jgi:hypothetical protein
VSNCTWSHVILFVVISFVITVKASTVSVSTVVALIVPVVEIEPPFNKPSAVTDPHLTDPVVVIPPPYREKREPVKDILCADIVVALIVDA